MAARNKRGRDKRRTTKDRVLQARIPEQLDEELRNRAEQLGLSVSTIVRNALLHTFELVEGVVADSAQIGRAIQGRATQLRPELPPPDTAPYADASGILGWQEAILNLNGICDECNAVLHKGERAALGIPTQPRPVLLCIKCLKSLSVQSSENEEKTKPSATPEKRRKTPNS